MYLAAQSWNEAGSKFRFKYQGITDRNPNIFSLNYSTDGFNDIGYVNDVNNGVIIAATKVNNENITETDTTFNTYNSFTTAGVVGNYDVQNAMTHEFGHWLNLKDLGSILSPSYCGLAWESTMCGTILPQEINKRDLEGDDKDGIKAIYET